MIEKYKLVTSNYQTACEMLKTMLSTSTEIELNARPWKSKRSEPQNRTFHMWMGEQSKYLISKGRNFATPGWCKDAMKHTFLGYEEKEMINVLTGEVIKKSELRHTSDLDTGDMTHFMDRVYEWSLSIGCLLTIPDNCEYAQLKQKQES